MSDRVITFVALFASWVVLSGQFDAFHLTAGAICALAVTLASGRLWFDGGPLAFPARLRQGFAFAGFLIWLTGQIVSANFYVIYLALHPRCRELIQPRFIRFRTRLKTDFARFALANSITLTPGTITVEIHGDEFLVHAINDKTAADLPGEMEIRLLKVFEPGHPTTREHS